MFCIFSVASYPEFPTSVNTGSVLRVPKIKSRVKCESKRIVTRKILNFETAKVRKTGLKSTFIDICDSDTCDMEPMEFNIY
ncbi:uncharacterized protein LOC105195475 isoform X2 [Solenopsis invicta]|uniref:uncharacterized protein LOC105195475 isoform X2 n=1 Tax=Solenopsis invicta TaxID=13686 RepID=UPI00059624F2|nr:uncharacterized protein LOC105195475 isoform X2 [Solenopsis invicta]